MTCYTLSLARCNEFRQLLFVRFIITIYIATYICTCILPSTITVMFLLTVWVMFPALLVATQVYTVV